MQQQASQQYWPGASSSTPATTAQQLGNLPTPPTDGTDGFKPPGHNNRESVISNLATAAVQQPGMASNLEPTGAASSLTSRRPAAGALPNFELPVPFGQQLAQKYGQLPAINGAQSTQTSVSVGNLLTPPSTVPGENLSPISSALNGLNSSQSYAPPYTNFAWPPLPTGLTPIGIGSGTTPQSWTNPLNQSRGLFSPSLSTTIAATLGRGNSNSPSAADGLPPSQFEMKYDVSQLPPIPTSMSISTNTTLPTITTQQTQAMAYMNQTQNQTQTPVSATTQASPSNVPETYMQRPGSTPAFYSQPQPSPAHPSAYPTSFNSSSSPIQQGPMSAPPHVSRISATNHQSATFSPPASHSNLFGGRSTYGPYSLPAPMSAPAHMGGPIMSNLHNPNNPMGLVGMPSHGVMYNSGHAAHMQQQMYVNPQPTPHNERPFKCDQCPQSFNRNHDLKRHKRIHLAVKPFPCGFCEKSFSRKDALKVSFAHVSLEPHYSRFWQRHVLVKGCGKSPTSSNARDREESPDAQPKDESSDNGESPMMHDTPT